MSKRRVVVAYAVISVLAITITSLSKGEAQKPQKLPSPGQSTPSSQTQNTEPDDYAKGFKDGLQQHQAMLNEIRKELDAVAKSDRFLSIAYLALAVGITGAGLLSFRNLIESTKAASEAKEEVKQFTSIRLAILDELHDYLKHFQVEEGMLNTDTMTPLRRAHLDEIDHLTFLANPLFRFREPNTQKEIDLYSRVLLTTVRWHLSERRHADGLARLDLFFRIRAGSEGALDASLSARAHSYRAYAYIGLLDELQQDHVVNNPERPSVAKQYRKAIEESLAESKKLDPSWSLAYVWEGLYQSLHAVIPEDGEREKQRAYRSAQESAIETYRKIIRAGTSLKPDFSFTALINICCCLKRIGDVTGNYEQLFGELGKVPPEKELVTKFASHDSAKTAFWRKIMKDGTFFARVPEDKRTDYRNAWLTLLRRKVNVTQPTAFCVNQIRQNPGMQSWDVRLWN